MPDLTGKKALITGARHGLGAAIARKLAAAGATVAVCGRSAGDCAAVAAEIVSSGGSAFDHELNVADLGSAGNRLIAAVERLGGLNVLVNNAAMIEPMAKLGAIDPMAFDDACRVNLSGALAVTNAAWPALAGGGRVLNVLSGAAVNPVEGWTAYCASKAGLHMLTRMIDLEGGQTGVRGFGYAPGLVDTEMQGKIRRAKINRISDVPRDQLADPRIPAEVAVWLVSGEADDLAGTMVDIRDPEIKARIGRETN